MTPATRARRDQAGEWRKGLIDREDGWQQGFSGRAGRGAQAGPGVRHNKVGPGDQGQGAGRGGVAAKQSAGRAWCGGTNRVQRRDGNGSGKMWVE